MYSLDRERINEMILDIIKFLTVFTIYNILYSIIDEDANDIFSEEYLRISLYVTIGIIVYYFFVYGYVSPFLRKK